MTTRRRRWDVLLSAALFLLLALLFVPECDDCYFIYWDFASWKDFLLVRPIPQEGVVLGVPSNGRYLGNLLGLILGKLAFSPLWPLRVLILGGGMLATMAKHGRMNDAQNATFQARQAISRFRTELADVSQLRVPDLQVGGFTSFADYFFDGLFVDLYIQDKIGTARRSAEETAAQVEDLLSQLRRERDRTAERAAELERERERLLAGM